jgi:pimeloyl-ACP methyl ester carboxylesterase
VSVILSSCAPNLSVQQSTARISEFGGLPQNLAVAKKELSNGQKIESQQPLLALGHDLAAASAAAAELGHCRDESQARDFYNFAVARSVENIQRAGIQPWIRPVRIPGPHGEYVLQSRVPSDCEHDPSNYSLLPTDTIKVSGKFLATRSIVKGMGAPLVAIGRNPVPDYRTRYDTKRIYAPVTAVVTFHGHRAAIEFVERISSDRISIDGRAYPLAADFTAPLALAVVRERPYRFAHSEFVHPEKYRDAARLIRLQPFDRHRTPVILVHGLESSPTNWAPMLNTLLGDRDIRRRYQFWVFSYPTGFPYPYSALQLRHELDGISRAFPDHKPAVLIGHSLGGMVARLMIIDAGDKIWRAFFGSAPAHTPLPDRTLNSLKELLVFNHRPDIKRVIFITTPHRGTRLASSWIGRVRSSLVKRPAFLVDIRNSVFASIKMNSAASRLNRVPTSIETLAPDDPFVLEASKIPISSAIPYHSILADRGRGGGTMSSDGVVGYWSSHLEGAQSEFVAPSNHSAQKNPEGIAEVRRILRTSD